MKFFKFMASIVQSLYKCLWLLIISVKTIYINSNGFSGWVARLKLSWMRVHIIYRMIFYVIIVIIFLIIFIFIFFFFYYFFVHYFTLLFYAFFQSDWMLVMLYFEEIFFLQTPVENLPDFFDFDFQYSLFCLSVHSYMSNLNNLYFYKLYSLLLTILKWMGFL